MFNYFDQAEVSSCERAVMRRVYLWWLLRSSVRPSNFRLAVLLSSLVIIQMSVSLTSVWHNLSGAPGFGSEVRYAFSAWQGTELLVQVSSALILAATTWWLLERLLSFSKSRS